MTIDITPLSASDQEEAAEICARAYMNDPSTQAFLEDKPTEIRFKILTRYWSALINETLKSGSTMAAFRDRKLIAVNLFYTHNQYPVPFLSQARALLGIARVLVPWIGVRSFLHYAWMVHRLKKSHPREPHFYNELICVDPAVQRQGVYTALRSNMLRLADQAGAGIYEETSNETNIQIFSKFGFQVINEKTVSGITYWSLWREPRRA